MLPTHCLKSISYLFMKTEAGGQRMSVHYDHLCTVKNTLTSYPCAMYELCLIAVSL